MKFKMLAAGCLLSAMLLSGCANPNPPTNIPTSEITQTQEILGTSQKQETPAPGTEAATQPPFFPIRESGIISSDSMDTLKLWAEWEAVTTDGKTATVTVKVGVTCHAIRIGKRTGTVTVNEETKSISFPEINYQLDETKKFPIATFTYEIDLEEDGTAQIELAVLWMFDATYDGIRIEKLTASAEFPFPGSAKQETETKRTISDPSTTDALNQNQITY